MIHDFQLIRINHHSFCYLLADTDYRVQRGQGILEYHSYLMAANLIELVLRNLQKILPPVHDISVLNDSIVGKYTHDGL